MTTPSQIEPSPAPHPLAHQLNVGPLSPPSPNRSWQGHLDLEWTHQHGETWLSRCQVQAPLKMQRSFYPEGKAVCHGVALHTAGGVVGGDRLSYRLQVQPQAQVLLTTAAATKIYRSNGWEAQQTIEVQVGANACLEWLPQETIVFDGALYRQTMRVELAPTATWLGWEMTRFGRSARGERFCSGMWRSHTEVWQAGRLLWVDPQGLQGGSAMLDSQHGLAGQPVVGSLALLGQEVSQELVQAVRGVGNGERGMGNGAGTGREAEVGVTRLRAGLLCRYRGGSTLEARRWFMQIWDVVRRSQVGRSACVPRVWQK